MAGKQWVGGVLALGLVACAATPTDQPTQATQTGNVVSAEFGVLEYGRPGELVLKPTNVIPLRVRQNYGWRIVLRNPPATVRWREEFTLPSKPVSWGGGARAGQRSLAGDGRTLVTERTVKPVGGVISNAWQVLPGDPRGRHQIKVSVDGKLVTTFDFELR